MAKKHFKAVLATLGALFAFQPVWGAVLSEDFDTVANLAGQGWVITNNSTTIGTSSWFQGNPNVFPAQQSTGYAAANFNATTGANDISLWLLTPNLVFSNGDQITFFTRTVDTAPFADRMQLRLSTNGASADVGSTSSSLGDFSTLLLDVNPALITGPTGYPDTWTQYTVTVSGLAGPTSGRLAFRYFVTNGGPGGANSDYIGIDTLRITPVPEPSTLALAGLGLLGVAGILRQRRLA